MGYSNLEKINFMFIKNTKPTFLLLLLICVSRQQLWGQGETKYQKQFAYVKQFYKQVNSEWQAIAPKEALAQKGKMPIAVDVDYVQMLTGKAAIAAAIKRGDTDTSFDDKGKILDVYVPNDYYMVNDNTKIRRLVFSKQAAIIFLRSSPNIKESLFELNIKNDTIIRCKEVYLP